MDQKYSLNFQEFEIVRTLKMKKKYDQIWTKVIIQNFKNSKLFKPSNYQEKKNGKIWTKIIIKNFKNLNPKNIKKQLNLDQKINSNFREFKTVRTLKI